MKLKKGSKVRIICTMILVLLVIPTTLTLAFYPPNETNEETKIEINGGYKRYYILIDNQRNETIHGTYNVTVNTFLPRQFIKVVGQFTIPAQSSTVIPIPIPWCLFGITRANAQVTGTHLGINHCVVSGVVIAGFVIITMGCL